MNGKGREFEVRGGLRFETEQKVQVEVKAER
jgi:hypothetical protein